MNVARKLSVSLDSILPELIDRRMHFHAHPELSGEEHQTAALVAGELRKYGRTVTESIGRTGLIAELGNISTPLVGLRVDMDALLNNYFACNQSPRSVSTTLPKLYKEEAFSGSFVRHH